MKWQNSFVWWKNKWMDAYLSLVAGPSTGGLKTSHAAVELWCQEEGKWLRHTFSRRIVLPGSAVFSQDGEGLRHTLQPASTVWETAAIESHSHFCCKGLILPASAVEVQFVGTHNYLAVNCHCCAVACVMVRKEVGKLICISSQPPLIQSSQNLIERQTPPNQTKGGSSHCCLWWLFLALQSRLTNVHSPSTRVPF